MALSVKPSMGGHLRNVRQSRADNAKPDTMIVGRESGSAAFSPSTRHDVRSGGSRPYCGCAKDSGLRARGRCASRTSCCRSVSVSRRLIKPEMRAVLAYRAAYARICDKPPTRYRGSAKSGPSNPTKELEVSSRFRLKRSQSKLRGSSGDRSTGFISPCPTILVRGIFHR